MRELYKVKAKELNASESFDLYFWGNDKSDAVSLAAEVCTKDKLEMLDIKFVFKSDEVPQELVELGPHSTIQAAYSMATTILDTSNKIH
jgi:hypothetical protein